jgi:phenylalanyl-tRNA synthetase beta chain
MASVKFDKKMFEKEIGKLDEKMQNRIAMFGTTVEGVGDNELEIDVSPNRPDLLSYRGFKRSFLAFLGKNIGLKNYKLNPPEKDFRVIVDSSVSLVRPFTACAIVKGMKFNDEKIKEIVDIQEKLHVTVGRKRKKLAIGIYPMEKIKLPITFKAMEPDKIKFKPLESIKEMTGLQILSRHPTGRDYAHLLAGKSKFPIFVDADNEVLSMPPIINSEMTGRVTEKTSEVFIECSGYDFEILNKCLNILVTAMADMGGKIYQMNVEYKKVEVTPNLDVEEVRLSVENVNKVLGLDLNEKEVKTLIEKMGHSYNKGIVGVSAWRTDVLHEIDLIEDVAIAYGYENFVPEIPEIATTGEENRRETIKRKMSEVLSGLNMLEVSNYHLTTLTEQFSKMGVADKNQKGKIEIIDSKTEYSIMRNNLSHYLMKNLSENVDVEYPQKIYEIGRIFNLRENGLLSESDSLSIACTPSNFTELKQYLEYFGRMIGVRFEVSEAKEVPGHFIDGRCAEVILEDKVVGYFGEIHPKILRNFKIKMPVALLEISLEEVFGVLG